MKRFLLLLISVLFLLPVANSVSAQTPDSIVTGTITDTSGNVVQGATVNVECNGNVKNTTSTASGSYVVTYPAADCGAGDNVSVFASKDGQAGQNNDTMQTFTFGPGADIDIAIISVALVPEFTTLGTMGILAASAFFLKKRDKLAQ